MFRTCCTARRRRRVAARRADGKGASHAQDAHLSRERLQFGVGYKRLSTGRFAWWPKDATEGSKDLLAHELQLLLWNGDPGRANAQPAWRPVKLAV